ncbi:DUF4932 domain-containing protein [Runella slithyformis]|nr:DUF4932 domain-containing protein [Runella slithyformis]
MTIQKNPFFTLKLLVVAFLFGIVCTSCGNPLAPKARFSAEYQRQNRQQATIEIPEAYELSAILVALTGYRNVLNDKDPYVQAVKAHFAPFKSHPMVKYVAKKMNKLGSYNYLQFRKDAIMRSFTANNKLINNEIYQSRFPINAITLGLADRPALLRDFVEKSNFRSFYAQQKDYYQRQIGRADRFMPMQKMWKWAESQFPARYDSYKIFLTAMDGGFHFTFRVANKGFRQTLMFVTAPNDLPDTRTEAEKEGAWSRMVFTEIDHNYVNPVTDTYRRQVEAAMPDWKKWNQTKAGNKGMYESAYLTFNEYMTWATFSLYAYDNFSPEDFEKINKKEEDFMVNGRGFHRFREFNQFVLNCYKNRAPNQTVADLYPAVIEWLKKQP